MEVEFEDEDLDLLEVEPSFTGGHPPEAVRGFRKAMQAIRAAADERDLYRGGLRFEKLQGDRDGQHSVRLNKQWRLILRVEDGPPRKAVLIEITDYH